MRTTTIVAALVSLAACESKPPSTRTVDQGELDVTEADLMAKLHEREAARITFERKVVEVLTKVDYDCASERPRVHEDPLLKGLEAELPGLARAASLDGVQVALACPVQYAPGSYRPPSGTRAELSGLIVATAGEEVGMLTSRGSMRDTPGQHLSWGRFQLPTGAPVK